MWQYISYYSFQKCLGILDIGARESLSDVVSKVLKKILSQPEGKEEELDDTLLTWLINSYEHAVELSVTIRFSTTEYYVILSLLSNKTVVKIIFYLFSTFYIKSNTTTLNRN